MAGGAALTDLQAWALAFALTQLVELPVYRAIARVRWWQAFSLSLVTHPLVWFSFPGLYDRGWLSWTAMTCVAEAFAYATEAAMLRGAGVRWPRAILASCAANTASIAAGALTRALWGVP
ncbi:MAG TPA: hypothetical protein VGC42_15105 [Kofleriaceae bacterium]